MSLGAMENYLFSMKCTVKELDRNSKKCAKEESAEVLKCKKAMAKGNNDIARIHAENAIRQKGQSVNYLRMSARVDAVVSRVQSAVTTRKVTRSMAGVVRSMESALKSMNLEKISALMDNFEKQFESLDTQSSVTEQAMNDTTTTSIPQKDVDNLLLSVAEEAGIELHMELPQEQISTIASTSAAATQDQDELSARLARLRNL